MSNIYFNNVSYDRLITDIKDKYFDCIYLSYNNMTLHSDKLLYRFPYLKQYVYIFKTNDIIWDFENYIDYVTFIYCKKKEDIDYILKITPSNKHKVGYLNILCIGSFDMFHLGHEKLLQCAKYYSNNIFIGLYTDEYCKKIKYKPYFNYNDRKNKILNYNNKLNIFSVNDDIENYLDKYNINLIISGNKNYKYSIPCIYIEKIKKYSRQIIYNKIFQNVLHEFTI